MGTLGEDCRGKGKAWRRAEKDVEFNKINKKTLVILLSASILNNIFSIF